ncbi:hypothetical protein LXL04_009435 [Taraxacum kok-saghyz]
MKSSDVRSPVDCIAVTSRPRIDCIAVTSTPSMISADDYIPFIQYPIPSRNHPIPFSILISIMDFAGGIHNSEYNDEGFWCYVHLIIFIDLSYAAAVLMVFEESLFVMYETLVDVNDDPYQEEVKLQDIRTYPPTVRHHLKFRLLDCSESSPMCGDVVKDVNMKCEEWGVAGALNIITECKLHDYQVKNSQEINPMSKVIMQIFEKHWGMVEGMEEVEVVEGGKLTVVTSSHRFRKFRPEIQLVIGYFRFIWSSRSQVNSGPRLAFHRTFTIGIRLCLSLLTSRSMISTGSSTKRRFGFTCISSKGTTRDSSDKHFLRFDTWNVSCMP